MHSTSKIELDNLGADSSSESDRVYQLLKLQILSGERGPGALLGQEAIAREFKTSRTPTREAVLRLTAEGLVKSRSGRSARVGDFSAENELALSQARALIEGYAVRRACRFMPAEVIQRLRSQVRAALGGGSSTSSKELVDADQAVHLAIAEWSNNPILAGMMMRLNEMNQMSRGQDAELQRDAVLAKIEDILQAIEDRNAEQAHKLMHHHIMNPAIATKDLLSIIDI